MKVFSGGDWRNLPPHIYSIAESAYVSLKRTGLDDPSKTNNQSIVISGESGGMTERQRTGPSVRLGR
jgi:myosin heavy subunit